MSSYMFPARFEFLDEIRELVAQVARAGGFSEKSIYSLQLAADEAASNIIEHAYEGESDASLEITCEMKGNKIVIILHDWGKPFDPSGVKDPNLSADLSSRQVGGLGIYLMRKLMDTVRYESNTHSGNLLVMTKQKD